MLIPNPSVDTSIIFSGATGYGFSSRSNDSEMISTTTKSKKIPLTNPESTSTLSYPNGNVELGANRATNEAYTPIAKALESMSICTESDISPKLLLRKPYTSSTNIKEKLTLN